MLFPAGFKLLLSQLFFLLYSVSELVEKFATFFLLLHDPVNVFIDGVEALYLARYLFSFIVWSVFEDWA